LCNASNIDENKGKVLLDKIRPLLKKFGDSFNGIKRNEKMLQIFPFSISKHSMDDGMA
jgi:hypothetical protein